MVMPMTKTDELRPLERRVLEIIHESAGEWLTRGEIAKLLGRPGTIQPSDIAALEKLAVLGLIESREATRGVAGIRWEYRVQPEN